MAQRSIKHSARLDNSPATDDEDIAVGVPVDPGFDVPGDDPEAELHAVEDALHASIAGAPGDEERKRRSELAAVLHPNSFPAERDAIIRVATDERALRWMLELLEQLPIDTRFDTVQDVWLAVGGHREERGASSTRASVRSRSHKPSTAASETIDLAPEPGRVGSERSLELMALGIVGSAFDRTLSVVRVAAALVRRIRPDRV